MQLHEYKKMFLFAPIALDEAMEEIRPAGNRRLYPAVARPATGGSVEGDILEEAAPNDASALSTGHAGGVSQEAYGITGSVALLQRLVNGPLRQRNVLTASLTHEQRKFVTHVLERAIADEMDLLTRSMTQLISILLRPDSLDLSLPLAIQENAVVHQPASLSLSYVGEMNNWTIIRRARR